MNTNALSNDCRFCGDSCSFGSDFCDESCRAYFEFETDASVDLPDTDDPVE